ncbi:MAG: hypothetical protein J0647_01110 [Campylobacteraceae bacterium]|nr:hypothetical protein [Campylobacteraceae bacterium]
MAVPSEVNYSKSTTTVKSPPKQGENLNLFLRPGDELDLGFDLSKAQLQLVGGDVVATFPNGGRITFVSLGMMAFEDNAPFIKFPNGTKLDLESMLNTIHDIGQATKDSLLVSGDVALPLEDQKKIEAQEAKAKEAPVNDYNAYYVDPQLNIKPQDDIGPKEDSGKYLTESLTEFVSDHAVNNNLTGKYNSTQDLSKSQDNVGDVKAALDFDLGVYQIGSKIVSSDPFYAIGGTGSSLGTVDTSSKAQYEVETLDYYSKNKTLIITDNANYTSVAGDGVEKTYLTKMITLFISQPPGFAMSDVTISGLPEGFEIVNTKTYTNAKYTGSSWVATPQTYNVITEAQYNALTIEEKSLVNITTSSTDPTVKIFIPKMIITMLTIKLTMKFMETLVVYM